MAPGVDSGDTAWMLAATALVLLMTPALGLFYAGLVRSKNTLNTFMMCVAALSVATICWAAIGYSLAFDGDAGFIGGLGNAFLHDVTFAPRAGTHIPHLLFFAFQATFCIVTTALVSGAVVERMRFGPFLVFAGLWSILVYSVMAHWAFGGGFLQAHGTLDFAGGVPVEMASGFSALAAAMVVGARKDYGRQAVLPHNSIYVLLGAGLLWFGWFGFNAGSALAANALATSAFVATHFATAAAALAWMIVEWIHNGKPSILGAISGAVAGLVAITPASGFVTPMPAMLIGLAAGVVCYLMVAIVKKKFGYDDALDAFGVHGIGGTVGAILTGVFATKEINDLRMGKPMGLVDGNPGQVINNLIGAAIAWGLAIVGTWIILKVCDAVTGVRASEQDEIEGLDLGMHGEEGYNFEA
jgi:Amt family ammonium transporter